MIESNEVVSLALSLLLLAFCVIRRQALLRAGRTRLLFVSLSLLAASLVLTVAEDLVAPRLLDALEHICGAAYGLTAVAWLVALARRGAPR